MLAQRKTGFSPTVNYVNPCYTDQAFFYILLLLFALHKVHQPFFHPFFLSLTEQYFYGFLPNSKMHPEFFLLKDTKGTLLNEPQFGANFVVFATNVWTQYSINSIKVNMEAPFNRSGHFQR